MGRSLTVIGVDPGTAVTGYGIITKRGNQFVVIDYGCIRPPRTLTNPERRKVIYDALCHLIAQHGPDALAVETQFVGKNVQSAITLGMARGVCILAGTNALLPIFEYAPSKPKIAVTGNGRASKQQVQAMTQKLLNLPKKPPEDAADALALAMCHHNALPATVGAM